MRQRHCAALLLCGPLVAGCGAVTRIDFSGHSRPASPTDVSVWSGPRALRVEPSRISPGPVRFDITNQSGRPERFALTAAGGRRVAQTPAIPAGQTGQLKATLRGRGSGFTASDRSATESASLSISGRQRTGNGELGQP